MSEETQELTGLYDLPEPAEDGPTAEAGASGTLLEELTSEERVRIAAQAADSLRAEDIVALDLRELTIIADFFLICTGKSSIQIRSIADRIEERLRDQGLRKLRVEGYQEATWILLDYGVLVCHVMAAEQRAFYNLEAFWSSAPRLELELSPESTTLQASHSTFENLTPSDAPFLSLQPFPEDDEEEDLSS